MVVVFRMARDAGAAFITKNWVAAQLKRSAHFVLAPRGRYSHQTLLSNYQTVLHDLEHGSKLFAEPLLSFQHRLLLLLLVVATEITNL